MSEFEKWFKARARNPDKIALEEAFEAGMSAQSQAPSVPDGWKLVPIEPTETMINEGSCASTLPGPRYISEECARQCWKYMIAATPKAKP